MIYEIDYTPQAIKELRKLDKHTRMFVLAWIEKNLVGCADPRIHGKGLTSNRSGQWRYRVGDYRLIANISDDIVTVLVLNVGHRKEIY